jgi:hypothetical protein
MNGESIDVVRLMQEDLHSLGNKRWRGVEIASTSTLAAEECVEALFLSF